MTETTKTIFEKYQVRKTKKQKTDFINYIKTIITQAGYEFNIEKGLFGARNIIIGNPDKAKVIYTAHYDTCAVLPFPNFITPKNFIIYFFYQMTLILAISIILFALMIILYLLNVPYVPQILDIILWFFIAFLLFGPANKHTANDNTSGVTVILDTINAMPPDLCENVAFILFDLEEAGLWGSLSFRLRHNKMLKNKLVLNFDCVSDGNNILIAVKRKAKCYIPIIKEAFKSNNEFTVEVSSKGIFYPSDQALFHYGVAVAALKRTKLLNILYMNRIHTKHDTVYREENIEFLVKGAIKLAYIKQMLLFL